VVWGVGLQKGKTSAKRRDLGLKTRRLATILLLAYLMPEVVIAASKCVLSA
jgi:hypothetical protein